MNMEHITANAVVRHIAKSAGFAKQPFRLQDIVVSETAESIEFAMDSKGIQHDNLGDWGVAYDDANGIITVTSVDGDRSVYYVHWLPDRYKLAGWLYHRVG